MKFKGIIVGLGQVGLGYDINSRNNIFTHANAMATHPRFEFHGGVDQVAQRRKILVGNYPVPAFEHIRAVADIQPDIIVIATPASTHLEVVRKVLRICSPRLILCEKPMSNEVSEAEEILDLAEVNGATIAVNYVRRFEPGSIYLGEIVRSGRLGKCLSGVARYSNGLTRNGCHVVNLLQSWLGKLQNVDEIGIRTGNSASDCGPDLLLEFDLGLIQLLFNRFNRYTLFEIDLIGSEGRIRYERAGREIKWWEVEDDELFPGAKTLPSEPKIIPNEFTRYQWHVYENISSYLTGPGVELLCTGKDALETLQKLTPWIGKSDG